MDEPVSAGGPAKAKKPEKKKEMKLSKKQRKVSDCFSINRSCMYHYFRPPAPEGREDVEQRSAGDQCHRE